MRYDREDEYDAIGLAGGILLALTVAPQILRAFVRNNVADISLAWQVTFLVGNVLLLVNYVYSELKAVVLPLCMEIIFICLLIGVKLYFERTPQGKRRATMAALRKLRGNFILKNAEPIADNEGEPPRLEHASSNAEERSIDIVESDLLEEPHDLEEYHGFEGPHGLEESHDLEELHGLEEKHK